jgi:predicted dinucleotide-binding enzyme
MKIGFIGASTVAQTITMHALLQGHEVILSNSRGPESLTDLVKKLGAGVSAGTVQQAAEQDLVVLAVEWSKVQSALFSVSDWKDRVLVDATNRIASFSPFSLGDISGRTSSEIVADLAPGAKVVKAFNNIPMTWIQDFTDSKPRTALFVSGDDAQSKTVVVHLIEKIGFSGLDLGSLAIGGRLQQLGGPLASIRLELTDTLKL